MPLCKKYGVKVGLSSWFLPHNTRRTDIFNEEGGVVRAWTETLQFLKDHDLLDNVIYVDATLALDAVVNIIADDLAEVIRSKTAVLSK